MSVNIIAVIVEISDEIVLIVFMTEIPTKNVLIL